MSWRILLNFQKNVFEKLYKIGLQVRRILPNLELEQTQRHTQLGRRADDQELAILEAVEIKAAPLDWLRHLEAGNLRGAALDGLDVPLAVAHEEGAVDEGHVGRHGFLEKSPCASAKPILEPFEDACRGNHTFLRAQYLNDKFPTIFAKLKRYLLSKLHLLAEICSSTSENNLTRTNVLLVNYFIWYVQPYNVLPLLKNAFTSRGNLHTYSIRFKREMNLCFVTTHTLMHLI